MKRWAIVFGVYHAATWVALAVVVAAVGKSPPLPGWFERCAHVIADTGYVLIGRPIPPVGGVSPGIGWLSFAVGLVAWCVGVAAAMTAVHASVGWAVRRVRGLSVPVRSAGSHTLAGTDTQSPD